MWTSQKKQLQSQKARKERLVKRAAIMHEAKRLKHGKSRYGKHEEHDCENYSPSSISRSLSLVDSNSNHASLEETSSPSPNLIASAASSMEEDDESPSSTTVTSFTFANTSTDAVHTNLSLNIHHNANNNQLLMQQLQRQLAGLQQENQRLRAMRERQMDKLHKYSRKASKYKHKYHRMEEITQRLYEECVRGEAPRWHSIQWADAEQRIVRDQELASLREKILDLYKSHTQYSVQGLTKWRGKKDIEHSVQQYVRKNGEYCIDAMAIVRHNNYQTNLAMKRVIDKYKIDNHARIAALNGQYGVHALMDIAKHTCLGQYFGGEILQSAFGKVYGGTGEEHDHNIYAFDQQIDAPELRKLNIKEQDECIFVIDPFIGDWNNDELLLRYVNDCRADIDEIKPSKEDKKYWNVEFVGMKVNGWPQTYLIAKRDIKQGEELMTYYGHEFSHAISKKHEEDEKKKVRKQRIDKYIWNV
mmetsp:Transcript_3004/g.5024  ORF Transcript_3004/g.5024 Transcript_3004/m.5024 type:complete len:473 (+) Transcript_3004:50-1468(+)